ncbi:MAG: ribulose-phosphate 3-epimerase [Acidobacteriota bacterium]|nr:ribulose-phosphate 3-epimerase [Acidobacteriota bacterium]MDQ7088076.1 ribulose-phosphate 3-epimerase [Acidobacteriota bacterium]
MIEICPSVLSANFLRLADEVEKVARAGADLLHVDVMDGHFVPNLTLGPPIVEALAGLGRLPLDVHLMIEDPDRWIETYAEAGARRLTVHQETCPHLHRTLGRIAQAGVEAGVALNPATPLGAIEEVLEMVDTVLVMSVNPGFSGQRFIEGAVGRVGTLAAMARRRETSLRIQVDGGVNADNIAALVGAGARSFVAGQAVFGADDPAAAVAALRAAGENAA